MRITFVLPEASFAGGIRVVSIYADRLRQRGHEVTVVSVLRQPPTWRDRFRAILQRKPLPVYTACSASYFDYLTLDHHIVHHYGPITDADVPDADVVIATWWTTAEWVWRLSPRKGRKVHFVQGYESWGGPLELVDGVYRLPMYHITISNWLLGILRNRFQAQETALVPNSVDHERFFAPPRSKQAVPTVGFIYSSLPAKGTATCIQACQIARQTLPQLQLVCCGLLRPKEILPIPPDTDYRLNATDTVLRECYAKCDAWLFGAREEGFGLPILEAMACRTPVIGTPAGAAPELLAKGGGILVPPENPHAMADAIVQLARTSETQWQAMSDAALATATGYSWNHATDLFEAALVQAYANGHDMIVPLTKPTSGERTPHGELPSGAR